MMRRDDDGFDPLRLAVLVLDCDLRLAVRPQEWKRSDLARLGQPFRELVGQRDREGHQLGSLPARKADHHALVPRALRLEGIVLERASALSEGMNAAGRDVA